MPVRDRRHWWAVVDVVGGVVPRPTRENNRSRQLLDAAAELFAERGYTATTVRDVTGAVGMGPGSSYYHFRTKADLLLAVYQRGVAEVDASVDRCLGEASDDPWDRIEAATVGHIEAVLAPSPYARVIVSVLPENVPELVDELRDAREGYEDRWRGLIGDLDLPVDATVFRLLVLGAANSTQLWYREGRRSPSEIARTLVAIARDPMV
ncbi:MAG: TetR/AcrR family transcriptional regulator [Actinomycetota bacterium]